MREVGHNMLDAEHCQCLVGTKTQDEIRATIV